MKLVEGFVVLKIFIQTISSIINQNIYIIITHFTTSLFLILHISNTNIIWDSTHGFHHISKQACINPIDETSLITGVVNIKCKLANNELDKEYSKVSHICGKWCLCLCLCLCIYLCFYRYVYVPYALHVK